MENVTPKEESVKSLIAESHKTLDLCKQEKAKLINNHQALQAAENQNIVTKHFRKPKNGGRTKEITRLSYTHDMTLRGYPLMVKIKSLAYQGVHHPYLA